MFVTYAGIKKYFGEDSRVNSRERRKPHGKKKQGSIHLKVHVTNPGLFEMIQEYS